MSLTLTRFATVASLFVLLAACGANDAGSGNKGPRGNNSPDDGLEDPFDGTGGQGGGDWVDDLPDSGSTIDPDAACATTSMESNAVPPSVVFQLDYSGSMKCSPTEPGSASCAGGPGSRWFILRDALKEALEKLPAQAQIGLMHYPTLLYDGMNFCQASDLDAQIAPLTADHKDFIKSKLDALSNPVGGTPTHSAAVEAFLELDKLPGGNKFIVLATDGEATSCFECDPFAQAFCNQDQDNLKMIDGIREVAQKNDVRTFVIGVPGSENFRGVLSEMAKAGGTAKPGCGTDDCHFDMTVSPENFGDAIADVLGEISQQLLGCVYSIPEKDGTFNPNEVNVKFTEGGNSTDIYRDESRQDGWDYSADGKQIELFGPACEMVKASQQGRIDIVFGCPTVLR